MRARDGAVCVCVWISPPHNGTGAVATRWSSAHTRGVCVCVCDDDDDDFDAVWLRWCRRGCGRMRHTDGERECRFRFSAISSCVYGAFTKPLMLGRFWWRWRWCGDGWVCIGHMRLCVKSIRQCVNGRVVYDGPAQCTCTRAPRFCYEYHVSLWCTYTI